MAKLTQETISFQDAMDNVARLAALDVEALPRLGIVRKQQIVTDEAEFPEVEVLWLSAEGSEPLLEVLDITLASVHRHVIHLMKEMDWEDQESRKALEAIMALCGEAARRLEKYLDLQLGKKVSILQRTSMAILQEDYAEMAEKFQQDAPRAASEELKNLDAVRLDRDYELFYIRREDGAPYFQPELLRHMRLISDFESEGESFEEDPLLQVRTMMDRDLQASAKQMLHLCMPAIADFYKVYKRLSNNDLASALSQASMALLLAANPRNLLQNTTSKSCLLYFEDFIYFIRQAFHTNEYQKFVAYPPEKSDKIPTLLMYLSHLFAHALYTRLGGVKQEVVGLIHRTTRKGAEGFKGAPKNQETLWSRLSADDENYRSRLAKFPSGPLFKTLDLVRQEETEEVPFDPMVQGNIPMQLFDLKTGAKHTPFLHLPCPTRQAVINKVEILDEVRGLLRFYNGASRQQKHLMINLQDRTSWKEFIRCKALEELQKNAEFNRALVVVTLPKNTDFYSQANDYAAQSSFERFSSSLIHQLESAEGAGFYFPSSFRAECLTFARGILPILHRHFFGKRATLTRREREDMIELFTQFLVLKLLDHYGPTTASFTCKDGIDTSAAASAMFYAFTHMLEGDFETKEHVDYFRWLLYAPALFVRERPIDVERFNRVLTALERFDLGLQENRKAFLKDLEPLLKVR